MWAQEWGNIYDVVAPPGSGDLGYDVTDLLVANKYDPLKMVKTGEGFFSSLGFAPLPETFWQRSQITRPRDREVVCHARSEEHTSELQSLMRISYAVFCLKKKKKKND